MSFQINALVPELWCTDFETSLDFYVNKLGFEIAQRRGSDPHAYVVYQQAQIMLAHWEFDGSWEPWYPEPMVHPFGRGMNLQFMISDVQSAHDRIISNGVEPFLPLHTSPTWRSGRIDDRKQFIVQDPDGYLIRFSETVSYRAVTTSDLERLDALYAPVRPKET